MQKLLVKFLQNKHLKTCLQNFETDWKLEPERERERERERKKERERKRKRQREHSSLIYLFEMNRDFPVDKEKKEEKSSKIRIPHRLTKLFLLYCFLLCSKKPLMSSLLKKRCKISFYCYCCCGGGVIVSVVIVLLFRVLKFKMNITFQCPTTFVLFKDRKSVTSKTGDNFIKVLLAAFMSAGVNFINLKFTNFLYERHFGIFSLVTCM